MNKAIKIGICSLLILLGLQVTFADQVQESCFETLKENVAEIGVFEEGNETLKDLNYSDLEFSKYYKTSKLLGIELDEPLFETRFYSFGDETGLNSFTPFSPFVDGKMTEKFDENLKQYAILEEYLMNPEGEKIFLNCELVEIDGEDLKNLKGENYLGDYKAFSLLITDDSLDYKALYNENVSFVYNRDNFLWSKFFVFPEATKNNYFSFYDVIEDFTTLKFKDLSVFEDDDYEAYYPDNYYNFYAGYDEKEDFLYYSFWENIEKTFKEFAKKLTFKGEIHFDTFKQLLSAKDSGYFSHIWYTLIDSSEFYKYLKAKELGDEKEVFRDDMGLLEFFEYELDAGVLENIEKGVVELLDEKGIYYIVEEDSEINLEGQEGDIQKEIQNIPETPEIKDNSILYITLSLVIVIALFGFILLFRKPKKSV